MNLNKYVRLLVILTYAVGCTGLSAQTTPAFPTAEGYGMWATGGRGGEVVEVTNLNDMDRYGNYPEGSLRWALKQHEGEPLTIVFRVSGIIDLKGNDLRSNRNDLTFAGQTAPGDGICIKGGKVNIGGSTNIIMRHMRFRVGLLSNGGYIDGGALGFENGGTFIIDHCTFGWSAEENMTIYDNNMSTVQWCILHEGLYDAGHPKGVRGYGCQWGGQTSTYHHNLLAHNVSRTPRVNGARSNDHNVLMDYVNNVNYNWGKSNSAYGADFDNSGISHSCNWINNYYKPGPARNGDLSSYFVQASYPQSDTNKLPVFYMNGNHMEGSANTAKTSDNTLGLDASGYVALGIDKSMMISVSAFEVPYTLDIESALDAYTSVLDGAGAFPRDVVDLRIINDVETGTASGSGSYGSGKGMIDDPAIVGGFPTYTTENICADNDHDGIADYWEVANGLDSTNAEDMNTLSGEGYTYLEVYINGLVGEYLDGFEYPTPVYSTNIYNRKLTDNCRDKAIIYLDGSREILHVQSNRIIQSIGIIDIEGRVIKQYTDSDMKEVDLFGLPEGIYISKLESEGGYMEYQKFIK